MEILRYLGAVALVLGVLVFVHEFGHYAVAKLCGVRVEVFSLGFGKRLWGFRRGETDYRLSILPLGGYVKMAGENPLESRTGDPGEFTSHPRWQRFLIAIAGPTMNILFAVAVLTAVYMIHDEEPIFLDKPAVISWVMENSAAEKAGLQPGDKIIRIEDVNNPTWEHAFYKIMLNPGQPVEMTIERKGQILSKTVVPTLAGKNQVGEIGVYPEEPTRIEAVEKDRPAGRAGIQAGDEILALNGAPVRSFDAFTSMLQQNKDNPARISLLRNHQEVTITALSEYVPDRDNPSKKKYQIGVQLHRQLKVIQLPLGPAFTKAVDDCETNSGLIFELVGKLLKRKISMKQVSGPIGIMQISGEATKERGWTPLMKVMALISLNLAIFNLFPIPILDGGLMLMLLIESVMRRDISQQIKERVYQAAFVFLILFAVMVIYNDVAKNLSGMS